MGYRNIYGIHGGIGDKGINRGYRGIYGIQEYIWDTWGYRG